MLNQLVRVVRSVSISRSLEVEVDASVSNFFWANITPPTTHQNIQDESPRFSPPHLLRFEGKGPYAPLVTLDIGTQLETQDLIRYEIVSSPRHLRHGVIQFQEEAQCLPVDSLYPYLGSVIEKAGTPGSADIPLAMWNPSEETQSHGQFLNYTGYLSIEAHPLPQSNAEVAIGDQRFTISRSTLNLKEKIVDVTLKRGGRG